MWLDTWKRTPPDSVGKDVVANFGTFPRFSLWWNMVHNPVQSVENVSLREVKTFVKTPKKSQRWTSLFSCSECGKRSILNKHLLLHQRIHKCECPFFCPECGKSFIEKADLNRHRKLHMGERPFSCSECGKSLNEKADLKRHQRLPKSEDPYSMFRVQKVFFQKRHPPLPPENSHSSHFFPVQGAGNVSY